MINASEIESKRDAQNENNNEAFDCLDKKNYFKNFKIQIKRGIKEILMSYCKQNIFSLFFTN